MFRFAAITAAALCVAAPAFAADCNVQIEGDDTMHFNLKSIDVPASCAKFTVTLKHAGKMAKTSMGHNWVLTKASDMADVVKVSTAAGLAKDYIKSDDPRVIAHTKLLGGGESDSVTFDVAKLKAGEAYEYFCTFPGHSALMRGALQVK